MSNRPDSTVVGGEVFRQAACKHGLEGIVSKRLDRPYLPGESDARRQAAVEVTEMSRGQRPLAVDHPPRREPW